MGVGAGLSMYVVVVQKFTFAISSPDEFLSFFWRHLRDRELSSPRVGVSASCPVKAKLHYASYSSELTPNMFGASSELVQS